MVFLVLQVEEDSDLEKRKEKKPGGFFSALKRR
jgi:hypothetical protein